METLFYLKQLHSSVYLFFGTLISIQNCSPTVQGALLKARAAQRSGLRPSVSTEPLSQDLVVPKMQTCPTSLSTYLRLSYEIPSWQDWEYCPA